MDSQAKLQRERYVLIFVTGCLSKRPRFQRIKNPAALLESGSLVATPLVFSIEHRFAPRRDRPARSAILRSLRLYNQRTFARSANASVGS